jgi:hypothetical protein
MICAMPRFAGDALIQVLQFDSTWLATPDPMLSVRSEPAPQHQNRDK